MAFLNTHKEIENLISAGVNKKTAEAIIELHTKNQEEIATKTDVAILRSEMNSIKTELKSEMALVESKLSSEIKSLGIELRAEISEVRSDIRTLRADGLWLKALLLIILGLISKLVFFNT